MIPRQPAPGGGLVELPVRSDRAGDGAFGASRGTRKHAGIDYSCFPGQPVVGGVAGKVTKLGYCYGDDLSWRYVQVTDRGGLLHRFLYVNPLVRVGQEVSTDTEIGIAQDITRRYPNQGMLPHVHREVRTADGKCIDPASCLA
jgi:murein DD-endopeptidase MepM/ murein hydrolase activator NlpD